MNDTSDRTPQPDGDDATELRPEGTLTNSSSAVDGGRFTPGTILDARYRIVALLGSGGMGEVYRAEDLKLGETVALKFLPPALGADGAALARFHREVKTARAIAHPNVVRVYDIGEQDGQPFLSMEYVDGEDLSVLLRRIGRLPGKKALELARQICAGLGAAHRAGVLHRDLKPANVMIDGEGRAKINDFGLADLASELEGPEHVGTPGYMAPEQLSEGRASFSSDIYALGLVLYELFTGERPYRADSRGELISLQNDSEPTAPSSHVDTLDPLIESAILHCLARVPEDRPRSPLEVAASLPGGDPLAAALAVGETPSPEMVARAAVPGTLARSRALVLLLLALSGIVGALVLQQRQSVVHLDGVPLRPQVLEHQARTLLLDVGAPEGLEGVGWYRKSEPFSTSHSGERRTRTEWERIAARRPTLMEYVYRAAPGGIRPTGRWRSGIDESDPPPTAMGSATVVVDSRGRLRELLVVPASGAVTTATLPDWRPLFDAAELDPADWTPIEPLRVPPVPADATAAWIGSYPGQPDSIARVEAAGRGGKVVHWRLSDEADGSAATATVARGVWLALSLFVGLLAIGGWQAVRNFRSGRGDRAGALRIGLVAGFASLTQEILIVLTATTGPSLSLLLAIVAEAAFIASAVWTLYMTLEPVMRRHYPRALVSWSRLLAGHPGDPLVAQDTLVGLAIIGVVVTTELGIQEWRLEGAAGGTLYWLFPHGLNALWGPLSVVRNLFSIVQILLPLWILFLYAAPRLLVRNTRIASVVGALLLFGFVFTFQGGGLTGLLWGVGMVWIAGRIGLIGMAATTVFMNNIALTPATLDPSAWWAPSSWIGIGLVVALAIWSYRRAVASAGPPGEPRPE